MQASRRRVKPGGRFRLLPRRLRQQEERDLRRPKAQEKRPDRPGSIDGQPEQRDDHQRPRFADRQQSQPQGAKSHGAAFGRLRRCERFGRDALPQHTIAYNGIGHGANRDRSRTEQDQDDQQLGDLVTVHGSPGKGTEQIPPFTKRLHPTEGPLRATYSCHAVSLCRALPPPPLVTDQELARAVASGSESACALFVNRYRGLCFRIVRRFVDSDDDAFDLCQDIFIRALERIEQYRGTGTLAAWLGQLSFNIGRRRVEQRRGRREVSWDGVEELGQALHAIGAPSPPSAQQQLEHAQQVDALQQAMTQLSSAEHLVLTLFYFDELSLAEVSEVTGLPAGTIKSHLSRGRQRLRRLLQREHHDR